jgi:hypothetical protein
MRMSISSCRRMPGDALNGDWCAGLHALPLPHVALPATPGIARLATRISRSREIGVGPKPIAIAIALPTGK